MRGRLAGSANPERKNRVLLRGNFTPRHLTFFILYYAHGKRRKKSRLVLRLGTTSDLLPLGERTALRALVDRSPKSREVGTMFGQCIVCSKLALPLLSAGKHNSCNAMNRLTLMELPGNSKPLPHLCQLSTLLSLLKIPREIRFFTQPTTTTARS